MKENLKIKSTSSLRALESFAATASALSEIRRSQAAATPGRKSNQAAAPSRKSNQAAAPSRKSAKSTGSRRDLPQIERDIRAIFSAISSQIEEGFTVKTSQDGSGLSAKWTASIFRDADLELKKPNPVVMYAFYPDPVRADRLGSVAIYGSEPSLYKSMIDRSGSFFGRKVARTSLEMGRRPFVDVTFAA